MSVKNEMAKELITDEVSAALNTVLVTLLLVSDGDKAAAMRGVEAMHKDMVANVERFFAMMEAKT
jgi:hypothetical protein